MLRIKKNPSLVALGGMLFDMKNWNGNYRSLELSFAEFFDNRRHVIVERIRPLFCSVPLLSQIDITTIDMLHIKLVHHPLTRPILLY